MAATLQGFRKHLRDPDDSDEELKVYFDAAKSDIRASGVPDYANNALYDFFIYELAALFYEVRSLVLTGQNAKNARDMINSFVLKLRYAGEDPD